MEQTTIDFTPAFASESIKARVRERLAGRIGRQMAVSVPALALACAIPEKMVRAAVRCLIMEDGELIASATDHPAGYFIPTTADECIEAARGLRSRGIKILMRAARIQKQSLEIVFNQAWIEFDATREGGENDKARD